MSLRNRSRKHLIILALGTITLALSLYHGGSSGGQTVKKAPWLPDLGDGTYKNPVLYADYSDPDVIRLGDDFYLTASSFNCIPGLPILHSKDLVNWRIIGHALERQPPDDVFARPQHGNGVWAPAIRFHNNYFYIYYGDPDFGVYMVKARNPAGPWSTPLLVRSAKGWIDTMGGATLTSNGLESSNAPTSRKHPTAKLGDSSAS